MVGGTPLRSKVLRRVPDIIARSGIKLPPKGSKMTKKKKDSLRHHIISTDPDLANYTGDISNTLTSLNNKKNNRLAYGNMEE
jgi:hypothetical protein